MAEPLLQVANIETYYGPIVAIRGVSFTVPDGNIVTILGANGAGKTTILKTVSGVMDPQKGTVTFAGQQIQRMDPDRIMRLGLGHVPEGREVFPFLTVKDNLRMGAYTRRDMDGVARDLEMVYGYFPVLRKRADQHAGQLSGGEQQMLSISRALMSRPKLMLLDEPSLGLSPKLVRDIFEIILRINRERGEYGAQDRRLRLCAGDRPRGHGGQLYAAPRQGRHQGVLSWCEGRQHPRHAALEEEENLALRRQQGRTSPWTLLLSSR